MTGVPQTGAAQIVLGLAFVLGVAVRQVELARRADGASVPVAGVSVAGPQLDHATGADRARQDLERHADVAPHDREVPLRALGFHLQEDRFVEARQPGTHVLLDVRIHDVHVRFTLVKRDVTAGPSRSASGTYAPFDGPYTRPSMARGTSGERRAELLRILNDAESSVTGSELSSLLGVSRQAIVNDIAILRASGQAIIGGPHGYRIGRTPGMIALIHCNHPPERGDEEWEILLDRGIAVLDVGVDHSVFGEIRAPVVVESRADIDRHTATITEAGEAPLSVITGGRHTHRVRVPNLDALDAAKRELASEASWMSPRTSLPDLPGVPDRGVARGVTLRTMNEGDERTTDSGIELHPVYGADDLVGFDPAKQLGEPGEHPFTRGVYPAMYRERLWTMRQYAGMGTAAETNRRFRYLLDQGQTGLSVAFDLPTQMGLDSDHPRAEGEVGKTGVAIDSIDDMRRLFEEIPLDRVTTSMTINATAAILLLLYELVAEEQGVDASTIGGTVQNDLLKEYAARGTYIYPPQPSMRIITDLFAYCGERIPKWNTISISGYHMREAGATAAQEIAFTLANGIAYVQAALDAGL